MSSWSRRLLCTPARVAALVANSLLALALVSCTPQATGVEIRSHQHGDFVLAVDGMVTITGAISEPDQFVSITVNGIPIAPTGFFAVRVPVDVAAVFNRIDLVGTLPPGHPDGEERRETLMLAVYDGVDSDVVVEGNYWAEGAAMRISDVGLAQITPVIESLSSGALDISALITGQNPIAQGSLSGISYTANVVEVGFGGFGMGITPIVDGIDTDLQIDDFFLEIDLDLGFLGSCTLEIETTTANITGGFDLSPLASNPTAVDVNLTTPVGVALAGFSSSFVSGICDDPLLGDIIGLIIGQGDIQQLMQDGFEDNLADPDGPGPQDSVLAAAIQDALGGVSIAGPIGDAIGGVLDSPIASVVEEPTGVSIIADTSFTTTQPYYYAPDLPGAYAVAGVPPVFGPTTPIGGVPYGMAFGISITSMNQLLATQIENGLMISQITEMFGIPLNAALLAFAFPDLGFGVIPPLEPVVIDINPTMAPVMTGNPGPGGELTEMKIGALRVGIRLASQLEPLIAMEVDVDVGVDLAFTEQGLEFTIGTPAGTAITVVRNDLSGTSQAISDAFTALFPQFLPQLADAIDAFPIPSLLGLDLEPLEVAPIGVNYLGLFANLALEPTSQLENVVFTDLSSGDFHQSGGCWLREWRHRLSGTVLGNSISANARGMLGADAGCTTNDASSSATLRHRVNFDIVSQPDEEWTLDIDHSILGALDRISDGYTDGIGFQDGGGSATIGTVTASYAIAGGASGSFDFTPSATQISDGWGGPSSNEDVEFSGANGVTLVGTGDVSVELEFAVGLSAYSDSRTAFPTCNGDEMAIRIGKNDTIDNNFTAGMYPGMGSRNIADDGHRISVVLTSAPLPPQP